MDRLHDIVDGIPSFAKWTFSDQVRLFAWVLHADGKEHLKVADIGAHFGRLHLSPPANLSRIVQALEEKGDMLKSSRGYRLAMAVRDDLAARYGNRPITVQVHETLMALPSKLTSPLQKEYLDEALACCKHAHAWRAAVIMSWNLAYDHFVHTILTTRLAEFNAGWAKTFQKRSFIAAGRSDFQDVKESEVIKAARTAGITDHTQHKCLERSLDIRNDAAHPSGAKFDQPRAEAFILEVVQTIVLGLK